MQDQDAGKGISIGLVTGGLFAAGGAAHHKILDPVGLVASSAPGSKRQSLDPKLLFFTGAVTLFLFLSP